IAMGPLVLRAASYRYLVDGERLHKPHVSGDEREGERLAAQRRRILETVDAEEEARGASFGTVGPRPAEIGQRISLDEDVSSGSGEAAVEGDGEGERRFRRRDGQAGDGGDGGRGGRRWDAIREARHAGDVGGIATGARRGIDRDLGEGWN